MYKLIRYIVFIGVYIFLYLLYNFFLISHILQLSFSYSSVKT